MEKSKEVKILYTNWRGETAVRRIIPKEVVFVATEWHPEEQWCLVAFDLDKQADRSFACKDIKAWFLSD
ncbi:MAG: WYL domain-containing protein [Nanoarchaeota archaeon]